MSNFNRRSQKTFHLTKFERFDFVKISGLRWKLLRAALKALHHKTLVSVTSAPYSFNIEPHRRLWLFKTLTGQKPGGCRFSPWESVRSKHNMTTAKICARAFKQDQNFASISNLLPLYDDLEKKTRYKAL